MATAQVPEIRLYILGNFRVEREGAAIADNLWRLRSARMLVKALAATPAHEMHRETLQDVLWPHFEADAAYNNFRKALHLARRALEPELRSKAPSQYLQMVDDVVSLRGESIWIDADEFEVEARRAIEHSDVLGARRALKLYNGDVLPEDRYVEWVLPRREELLHLRLRLMSSLADMLRREGNHAAAINCLHQILGVDPLHEGAHRGLMRAYARVGDSHEAMKQYGILVHALRRELDVAPDVETHALYESIVAAERPVSLTIGTPSDGAMVSLPAQARRFLVGPFVGSRASFEMLSDHLENALAGAGNVVLVGGEAGVGKSRLMAELAQAAHQRGTLVLWGASFAEEGMLPYGPLVQALDRCVAGRSLEERAALATAYPEIAPLLTALDSGSPSPHDFSANAGGERSRLFAAVVRLLADLAAGDPLLLVLDDLHCADEGTLQVLHYLARSVEQRPWLIMGTYRQEEALHGPLRTYVSMSAREGLSQHIELLRMGRQDAEAFASSLLADGAIDENLLGKLFAQSLGNPLFLQQCLIAMREAGRVEYVGGSWKEMRPGEAVIPLRIHELIDLRVARLDRDTRHVLSVAAVIGMEVPLTLLRAASRLAESSLLDALDAAVVARLLDEVPGGYAFRHPLFREVLCDLPSAARRSALHRSVGEALECIEPVEVEALAYHFSRGGAEELARHYFESAGDRAAKVNAHGVALSHYRDALRNSHDSPQILDRARLTSKMAEVQVTVGRYDEAFELLEQAAGLYTRLGDSEALGAATARIGYVHAMRGTSAEGVNTVRAMLSRWNDVPSSARASLLLQLSRLQDFASSYMEELATVESASELAAQVADWTTLAEAESVRGNALMLLGRVDEAAEVLTAAVVLAEAAEAETAKIDVDGRLAVLAVIGGAGEAGARYAAQAVDRAEQLGDPVREAIWGAVQSLAAVYAGEWAEARIRLDRCIELNADLGDHQLAVYPLFVLGMLLVNQSNFREAHEVLTRARELSDASGNLQARRWTARALSELYVMQGHPQQALDLLLPLLDRAEMREWEVTLILPWVATAYRDLGRASEALETIEQAIDRAREQKGMVWLCEALVVRGTLRAVRRRHVEAEADFAEACTLSREIRYPLAEGHALTAWGSLLIERRQLAEAATHLSVASSIFHQLGARRFEASVREMLQRCGIGESLLERTLIQ